MKMPAKVTIKKTAIVRRQATAKRSPDVDRRKAETKSSPGEHPALGPISASVDDGLLAACYAHASTVLFTIAVEPRGTFRFAAVNQALLDSTGLERSQIIGRRVQDVIPEPSCSLVLKKYREALRTKHAVRWEESTKYPTGVRHGEVTVTPILNADGKVMHLAGVVHDITARKEAEGALQDSEARYRRIVQMAEEGIWTINAEAVTDFVNPKMAKMMGYRPEEMIGRPLTDFMDQEGKTLWVDILKRRKRGVAEQFEFKYVRKDGSKLWAFVSTNPIKDAKGAYVGAMALLTDITAHRAAEKAMRENEAQFRAIFEQAAVGVAIIDSNTGRFIKVNQRACEIIGLSPSQLTPTTFMDITHPDDLPSVMKNFEQLRSGQIRSYTLEKRNLLPSGKITWINLSVSAMWSPGEAPTCHIAVLKDITERKAAEDKYLRELAFNETLLSQTTTIIVLLDREGRLIYVNEATINILGYSRKDLLGRTPWEAGLMTPEEAIRSKERLQVLLRGGVNPPRETILTAKNGVDHSFSLSSVTTRLPDGKIDRIVVTGTDLTERNQLQKELLKISEQEQARIGHDLHDGVGQTMTGVESLMEALEGELQGDQRASASRIRQLIQQAIQEVRRMSHSMSPAAVKNRGLCGVLQLLAETIRINHRTACVCNADPDITFSDQDKETHIYRIAQEAASNAIRHGKPTKVMISLQHDGENACVLRIEDNGGGFRSKKNKPTDGIGVQVMDYRANLIGGTLRITSKPKQGVTVTCRISCGSSKKPC